MRRQALFAVSLLLAAAILTVSAAAQHRQRRSGSRSSRGSYRRGTVGPSVLNYAPIIEEHAAEFGVDPALIAAVIRVESNGDPVAVSRTGAMGLMQLKQETCNDYGVMDPYDPDQNIRGGTALLARDLRRYHGSMEKALAAYNAGPRRVDDGSWVHMSEPRNYVPAVLGYYYLLKSSERPAPTSSKPVAKPTAIPKTARAANVAHPMKPPQESKQDPGVQVPVPPTSSGSGEWKIQKQQAHCLGR